MKIKGFTYGWDGKANDYRSKEAVDSLTKLSQTGCNWVCIAFSVMQEKFSSTEMYFDYANTVKDRDIEFIVKKAHEMGKKVCLKPVVNCKDGVWRAYIAFPDEDLSEHETYWNKWFKSYTAFMCHYAEMAEYLNCEMFCIGCEMIGTEKKESYWRELIAKVRGLYTRDLIYNANHGSEDNVKWFDAVDYIGTSAYYPVATEGGQPQEVMLQSWLKIKERVKKISDKWNKKIIFIEIGCRSARGCASMPWDFTHTDFPFDEDEQANFYASCLKAFSDEEWFLGYFWWDWSTKMYDFKDAKGDLGFNIYGKKAEDVLKDWYLRADK